MSAVHFSGQILAPNTSFICIFLIKSKSFSLFLSTDTLHAMTFRMIILTRNLIYTMCLSILFRLSKIYHKPIVLVIYFISLQYPLHANSTILCSYLVEPHLSLSLSCWICREIPMISTFFPSPINTCLNPTSFQDAPPVPPLPRSIT